VAREGSGLTADDVTAHAATRLARFKRPTIVALVATLPHSATGKVAKGRLRAREVEELG
jgi:long-chain acyl-CoA synthetase